MSYSREEFLKQNINERILGISNKLREIADSVERNATNESKDLSEKIQDIQHDILWGLANLNMDSLIYKLTDYEREKRSDLLTD